MSLVQVQESHRQVSDKSQEAFQPLPDSSQYFANFDKPQYGFTYEWMQNYRLVAACLSSPVWLVSIVVNGLAYFLMYATQWTSLLTTIYFLVCWQSARKNRELEELIASDNGQQQSFRAADEEVAMRSFRNSSQEDAQYESQPHFNGSVGILGRKSDDDDFVQVQQTSLYNATRDAHYWRDIACCVQNMTVNFQFLIVFVFWAFCARIFLNIPGTPWWQEFGLIVSHSLPLFAVLFHLFTSDSKLNLSDWWHSFLAFTAYTFINYSYTKLEPEPVYPFLTWESSFTAVYFGLIWLVGHIFVSLIKQYQDSRVRSLQT